MALRSRWSLVVLYCCVFVLLIGYSSLRDCCNNKYFIRDTICTTEMTCLELAGYFSHYCNKQFVSGLCPVKHFVTINKQNRNKHFSFAFSQTSDAVAPVQYKQLFDQGISNIIFDERLSFFHFAQLPD